MTMAQMLRFDRAEDEGKRELAIARRNIDNREITKETRIYSNCNISIIREIEELQRDPF